MCDRDLRSYKRKIRQKEKEFIIKYQQMEQGLCDYIVVTTYNTSGDYTISFQKTIVGEYIN